MLEQQLEYWREQLDGAPAVLELPTDHAAAGVQTYRRGGQESFALVGGVDGEAERAEPARRRDAVHDAAGGFQRCCSRYSGQEDIVVGTPIANRNQAETEGLIGFFVNTLALRTELERRPELPGVAGAGERDGAGSVCASGCAVREAGGRVAAGAEPEPCAVVSGDVRFAERARSRQIELAGLELSASGRRQRARRRSSI